MRIFLHALISMLTACVATGGELRTVTWETRHASPPAKLDEKSRKVLPLIRLGVSTLSEAKVMQLTFLGGSVLGLPADKAGELHSLLAKRYREIGKDETFSKADSALAYCYSAKKPVTGRASVYVPAEATSRSPVILFLHGYGGSFTFYQHYLAEAFPDHVIVCPAYGISCAKISSDYLRECLVATSAALKFELGRPVLMGISAGGFGGFREYVRQEAVYAGYVCLAAYPPKDVVTRTPRTGRIRLVAGGKEAFVVNGSLQRLERQLKWRTKDYSSRLIPDGGHFFLLEQEEVTRKILREWDGELRER